MLPIEGAAIEAVLTTPSFSCHESRLPEYSGGGDEMPRINEKGIKGGFIVK